MQVEAAFPADGEGLELVEQGEGLFRYVAELPEAAEIGFTAPGDDGWDPALDQLRLTCLLS